MTILETRDWKTIHSIVSNPIVREGVFGDNWDKLKDNLPALIESMVTNPYNHVLLVTSNLDEVLGFWMMESKGEGIFEIHTCLLPACRGIHAVTAGKLAMKYVSTMPDVERMISYCPMCLPETYLFARLCGWKRGGLAVKKWLLGGQEFYMRIVQITKGELLACH